MLANPDCANFIKDLLGRVSGAPNARGSLVEGGDVLKTFDLINSSRQGGMVRSGQPGSQPGGAQANGYIGGGTAQIQLGIFQGGIPTAAQVLRSDANTSLHETLHHAGSHLYLDQNFAEAVRAMTGRPIEGLTGNPNKDVWAYSKYWDTELDKHCK